MLEARHLAAVGAGQPAIEKYLSYLNTGLHSYSITTRLEIAHLLSQIAHESQRFARVEENLNYSASGLIATFPRRVSPDQAQRLARKPEAIANHVYSNRFGNGPNEGWRFRGRGLKQITFRDNYRAYGKSLRERVIPGDPVENPDLLFDPFYAVDSALWFWSTNGCSVPARADDLIRVTRIINGGTNGMDDRRLLLERAKKSLEAWTGFTGPARKFEPIPPAEIPTPQRNTQVR
jgi:putative chitinase